MVQIVKKRKKGRPSKSDLSESAASERKLRRSGRRRNVRYTFDFDDYLEEDFDEEEDEERRERKLTQLIDKLQKQQQQQKQKHSDDDSSSDDYATSKPLKKRKICGHHQFQHDPPDDDSHHNNNTLFHFNYNHVVDNCQENQEEDDDNESSCQKVEPQGLEDSNAGTPLNHTSPISLPDKKTLELILDKLQKKDIYGVYAEPVDPEELPDYHEVINNPMDFATVRKKLANGKYLTLEQFENDLFLICTNAMQYNAPDTIYYKQALSIQELAKRKFQRLRIEFECSDKDIKTEEKTTSNSSARNPIKKTVNRTLHEPVGSDFSSGATLAMAEDVQVGSGLVQAGGCERPSSIDMHMEGNMSLVDKGEEVLPGKCLLSGPGKKAFVHDENRRATYTTPNPSISTSESTFSTFEGESKLLVPVGLHADHSYAWSLARFGATLGSVAWKVASDRIEQAVPAGFKFGRGWVGEYEPLPTPVLMLEDCTLKGTTDATRIYCSAEGRQEGMAFRTPTSIKEHHATRPSLEELPSSVSTKFRPAITSSRSAQLPVKEEPIRTTSLDGKPPLFCSPRTSHVDRNATYQQWNSQPRNIAEPDQKFPKQVELSRPPVVNLKSADIATYQQWNSQPRNIAEPDQKFPKQVELSRPPVVKLKSADIAAHRQFIKASEMSSVRLGETTQSIRNAMQSVPSKLPNVNGVVGGSLPNGHVMSSSLDSSRISSSTSTSLPKQRGGAAIYFPNGQEQGLSDPVQLMKLFAEKAQSQHSTLNHSPKAVRPLVSSTPSLGKEDSSNAAAAAAPSWMSIGDSAFRSAAENTTTHNTQLSAESLYNTAREQQPQVSRFRGEFPDSGFQIQPNKNKFPLNAFVPQAARMGIEAQFSNQAVVLSQSTKPDLSRFQVQSQWRGLNMQAQPRQKQECLPPDLNIGCQSSGSPVRQSSGVMVDFQQPDLALQL